MFAAMKIHLIPEQKRALELMHDTTRDSRVRDRFKAVLLASEGWTAQMIAQALRIYESTVSRHLKDFIAQEKLTPENGGSESHLSAEQTADLIEYLTALNLRCCAITLREQEWRSIVLSKFLTTPYGQLLQRPENICI
ncbi:DDE endonuclease [Xenorhabdus eapokensis]|uniref:DDE endonuclease n=1 Tax=Xenorhabdus eapokensis TaxID=1873482 RepID=A0A1Q5TQE5_9GAMM|nr:DDE endonuclease [Xenorhabdus eapokensis]